MNRRLALMLVVTALAAFFVYQIANAAESAAQPRIPHTIEGRDNCLACHGPGGIKPVPPSHAGRNVATCRGCHEVDSSMTAVLADQATPAVPDQAATPQATVLPTAQPTVLATALPTAQATAAAATPTRAATAVVSTSPTPTAPLPKTGDGDFVMAGLAGVLLLVLGVGMRKFAVVRERI